MVRKGSNRTKTSEVGDEINPYGLNEVDDFASKREKVLLGQSTFGDSNKDDDHSLLEDEDEEEVLAMDEDDESIDEREDEEEEEEEELDGAAAYKKIFGRNLETDQLPEEDEENGMLDNENAWGSTKGEYYGADDLDDDEGAKEIEKEALRQQKKHLEELNMNDYLDEEEEEEWAKSAKEFDMGEFKNSTKQADTKTSITDILNMDDEARDNYLRTMFPEFAPLSKEFTELAPKFDELKKSEENEFNKLKLIALGSYLGTISCYYSILLHELHNNEDFTSMKGHPVMEKILTTKEIWRQASELPSSFDVNEGDGSESEETANIETFNEKKLNELENSEDSDAEDGGKQKQEIDEEERESDEEEEEEDVDIDDFEEYVAQSRLHSKPKTSSMPEADDFIESEIADVDAQDKKARRRTLRFYTSKIDQQENKKTDRFKGDDDIPYKERLFERQQRLLDEARKRGMHDNNGTDLDDKDYGSEDEAVSRSINTQGENDYYQQVQRGKQDKKISRKEAHKNAVIAAREGKLAELAENVSGDGKRAINYQILKNKGLTPKRNKDNRNSRVKKRKKYQKAQKKLKSVRAVYSGGQSGVYEGEKTGIKKGLTRSVKFKN
ncbi:ASN_HP2_G0006930.mRNA.1.CDS.1 [Saccharomyces cerevisiae]|nr:BGP_1a_G0027870.mRNA.1.CDS.1 [Saccharomyces cerevisiae]CAI5242536.1 ASN_HP2_G0006930.mRNA.1.CDS.1 [Saccharomyces cerevisiae]CAI6414830.1 ASN_HP2_G0006930.mRNA.1.CDS.1 [Saccharomyces cerevisiae]CAI6417753.1 ASN_HP1_G0007220.mRNA.1.CDS.1 [Saccharomyces cerevisiae]CAI7373465.1 BGP_1a_G0027870.mRNA.1.CDS.1 [Saccharomyces cerevisiae]